MNETIKELFLQAVLQALAPIFKEYSEHLTPDQMVALLRKATSRYFAVGRPYKYCPGCRRSRERGEFGSDRSRYDQLTAVCRECRKR